jgi:excisionase family DNA binding protein
MVCMSHNIDGIEYLTIAEAVDYMGCTDGWVRILLRSKKLRGKQIGQRLWLVTRESASEVRDNLTTRAKGKKHLAKRPAAKRKKAKRKR